MLYQYQESNDEHYQIIVALFALIQVTTHTYKGFLPNSNSPFPYYFHAGITFLMLSQEQDIVFNRTLQVAESRIGNVWMTTVK